MSERARGLLGALERGRMEACVAGRGLGGRGPRCSACWAQAWEPPSGWAARPSLVRRASPRSPSRSWAREPGDRSSTGHLEQSFVHFRYFHTLIFFFASHPITWYELKWYLVGITIHIRIYTAKKCNCCDLIFLIIRTTFLYNDFNLFLVINKYDSVYNNIMLPCSYK